jgi:hypothetical protein
VIGIRYRPKGKKPTTTTTGQKIDKYRREKLEISQEKTINN